MKLACPMQHHGKYQLKKTDEGSKDKRRKFQDVWEVEVFVAIL
jgi:hypothetical protein